VDEDSLAYQRIQRRGCSTRKTRGRTTGTMSIMDAQRRSRAGLASGRVEVAGSLAKQGQRASVAAAARQVVVEAAPICYVAEVLGTDINSERAIRWLIAVTVLCCNPLALALTAVGSAGRSGETQLNDVRRLLDRA
jgi:hypothetical protein